MAATGASAPIESTEELVEHFHKGGKRGETLRIGVEHEKILVDAHGRAPTYLQIARVLEALAAQGWSRIEERGKLIALEHSTRGNVTLEPGGQFEHSGAPFATVADALRDADEHLDALSPLFANEELTVLACGFRPLGTWDDVPWMPKGRYRVMREYLPTRGKLGVEMMKRTATVQANFDYIDEPDAMNKLRVSYALSSLVTALFAASPLVDGKPSGFQSFRAQCWLDTDPDRCGMLPFVFSDSASFRDYAEWALDVPMFFLKRSDAYRPAHSVTFRRFVREGLDGERATHADWELHLSTLFPEVRLKRYIEVRQADASTREMVRALPALWRGLLYAPDSLAAAWKLVADWSLDERLAIYRETPRKGFAIKARGVSLQTLAREMVSIARAGLVSLGTPGEPELLDPLIEIADSGRTVADRILDAFAATRGDVPALIAELAF